MINITDNFEAGNLYRHSRPFVSAAISAFSNVTAAGIAATSTSETNDTNERIANKTNETNLRIHREDNEFNALEAAKARDFSAEQADKEREYNSLVNQMARAEEAGVNPITAIGNTTSGGGSTTSPAASSQSAPTLVTPNIQTPDVSALSNIASDSAQLIASLSDSKLKDQQTKSEVFNTRVKEIESLTSKEQIQAYTKKLHFEGLNSEQELVLKGIAIAKEQDLEYLEFRKQAASEIGSKYGMEIDISQFDKSVELELTKLDADIRKSVDSLNIEKINLSYRLGGSSTSRSDLRNEHNDFFKDFQHYSNSHKFRFGLSGYFKNEAKAGAELLGTGASDAVSFGVSANADYAFTNQTLNGSENGGNFGVQSGQANEVFNGMLRNSGVVSDCAQVKALQYLLSNDRLSPRAFYEISKYRALLLDKLKTSILSEIDGHTGNLLDHAQQRRWK